MRYLRILALIGICMVPAGFAHAQRVSVGIGVGPVYAGPAYVGPAPVCDYGYYPYAPYACAPYGYYGPSWFSGGVFIGAGPWYHGGFYGRPGFYGRGYGYGNGFRSFAGRGRGSEGFRGGDHGRDFAEAASMATLRFTEAVIPSEGSFHGGGDFRRWLPRWRRIPWWRSRRRARRRAQVISPITEDLKRPAAKRLPAVFVFFAAPLASLPSLKFLYIC